MNFNEAMKSGETLLTATTKVARTEAGSGAATVLNTRLARNYEAVKKIRADKTRTVSEQNHLILKKFGKEQTELNASLTGLQNKLFARVDSIKSEMLNSTPRKSEMIEYMMIQSLRDAQDKRELLQSDPAFFRVMSEAPAQVLGITPETHTKLLEGAAKKHFPDLYEERANLYHTTTQTMEDLQSQVNTFTNEINNIATSPEQQSRYSEE